MPNGPIIRMPTAEEEQAVLDEFAREMRRAEERRNSVLAENLREALETITDYLATGWSTGGGRRLRQFIWSLWNGHHLINLYDLSSGLDGRLTDAVIVVFRAAMVDALNEDQKRRVLKDSGEFARWEEARAETPEEEEVIYPPLPMSTDTLRRLANSATQKTGELKRIGVQKWPVMNDHLPPDGINCRSLRRLRQATDHPVRPSERRDRTFRLRCAIAPGCRPLAHRAA